jgi:hypothetical protein
MLSDRTTPLIENPTVWHVPRHKRLALVDKHVLAAKCDKCGEHKQTLRSRRAITVGLKSSTVWTKFCNEGAAMIAK